MLPKPASFVRSLAAVSLGLWCGLGLVHTTVVLSRPTSGLLLQRPEGTERAIGVPRDHEGASRLVTATIDLIDTELPEGEPVWLIRNESLENDTWLYLQMQLAHLAYPRIVEVLPVDSVEAIAVEFGYAVALGNSRPSGDWRRLGHRDLATLYVRAAS